jgi:hypothetical protein
MADMRRPARRLSALPRILGAMLLIGSILFLLYRPEGTTSSSGSPSDSTSSSYTTTLNLPTLGKLKLPGAWTDDTAVQTALTQAFAQNNGTVKMGLSNGPTIFGVVSVPVKHTSGTPASTQKQIGELLVIDGYQAERVDDTGTNSSGIATATHQYIVEIGDGQNLVIFVQTTASDPAEQLNPIEKALLSYPNSKGLSK